jgi:S-adenosylmethionine/arginine decarboxylase-like enzyme
MTATLTADGMWDHPGFGRQSWPAWLLVSVVAHVYRTLRPRRRRHALHCRADGLHATAPRQSPTASGTRAHRGRTHVPWGMLAAIDLHGCERSRLQDPDTLRRFVPNLIDAIGMRAHGPLALDRFGDGELQGWSAMQFIQTSSITVHADEVAGRCFVDIFSCRPFDPQVATAAAVAHFGGTATLTVLHR